MLIISRDDFQAESIREIIKAIENSPKRQEVYDHAQRRYIGAADYMEMIATHIFYEDEDFIDEE